MARSDFIQQLTDLGYQIQLLDPAKGRLSFPYEIPVGRLIGTRIRLGFVIADDFPLNPPSGPHISPRILPLNPQYNTHPNGGVHESPDFGDDWEYWSRPFEGWAKTDRSVRTYMAHIRHLLDTL